MQFVTKGLVLREVKTGEADRILTILTPQRGVVSAAAKSSMRLKNKLFSATGLFCYSDLVLFEGKNLYTVDEATPIEVFFGLRQQIDRMSLAMYLAELAGQLAPEGEPAEPLLRLLLNSFYLLSAGKKPVLQVKTVFELRALAQAGFMPDVAACAGCGGLLGEKFYFDLAEGTILCQTCAADHGRDPNITAAQLAALQHILYSEDAKAFSFTLTTAQLAGLSRLASDYVCRQLDRGFKTLDFLRTVL